MAGPIITLTTDFGTSDPYVGIMKGVILGINPQATIVDITHDVRPQGVEQAAFLIEKSHSYFPPGTIHVVVVDPGVGTSRRAVVLSSPKELFVAPDNGVLARVLAGSEEGGLPHGYQAYSLADPIFWRSPLSDTFHGRDVFGPVAAHLSLGIDPGQMGDSVGNLARLPAWTPAWKGNLLEGRVVHTDRFGNLVTDIEADLLRDSPKLSIEVKGIAISAISRSYAEGGEMLAIIGSFDTLEVAARNASAQAKLDADIGDTVRVVRG